MTYREEVGLCREARPGNPFEDLIQQSNVGLMTPVEEFEPEMGNRFSTYAIWWIRPPSGHVH